MPNPVSNQNIQIEFSNTIADEFTISLLNSNGQTIKNFRQKHIDRRWQPQFRPKS